MPRTLIPRPVIDDVEFAAISAKVRMSKEEMAALIAELTTRATQRRFQYGHRWRERALVIWDSH